jgi:hypothetical protein
MLRSTSYPRKIRARWLRVRRGLLWMGLLMGIFRLMISVFVRWEGEGFEGDSTGVEYGDGKTELKGCCIEDLTNLLKSCSK